MQPELPENGHDVPGCVGGGWAQPDFALTVAIRSSARSLADPRGLMGQLFPATLLARLAGFRIEQK
jgi:hypothetical protein